MSLNRALESLLITWNADHIIAQINRLMLPLVQRVAIAMMFMFGVV